MDHKDRLKLLSDLIKINTVGGREEGTAKFLSEYLANYGIHGKIIEVEPGRFNLVAEIGDQSEPVIVFEGHQDTVDIGDRNKWIHNPFGAEIVGDRMYGRGTSDMKAGLAAEVIAMIELKEAGQPIKGTIRLLATIGEESSKINHMQGAKYFAEHGYLDDVSAAIVAEPSGEPLDWLTQDVPLNPFKFSKSQIKALVDQNNSAEQYMLSFAHKGSITYETLAKGKTAHSSSPQLGINAIAPLIKTYDNETKYFRTLHEKNPILGKTIPVVTKIDGGDQLNSVPASAAVYAKIRTIPEEPNAAIIEHLKRIVTKNNQESAAELTFKLLGDKAPVVSDPNDRLIQILKKHGEQLLQQSLPLGGYPGGTDAAEFVKVNPKMTIAVFGPGNMTAHQVDEFVELENFERFIEIYKQTVHDYLEN
ncbi:M20/M25/M40 family metallo-hydrolase [Lentilactobacillus raoultii]|uniref:M20/M25/M40 family metallo-hydrolase n=1 Tax=Lentilactobacillus raoultii TaxID=1987503 RepID=A0ABW3PNN8_9LACO|nr:M20/M25/M40 family metallo-hydrolase [Lentilactobacillus raoultii]